MDMIIGIISGAIIGGITNSIAIKMLFRPLNPIKIGGYQLPFTPGVIPKEKERLALKIGQVVSEELLSEEVLRNHLLNATIYEKLESSIEDYLTAELKNTETLYSQLSLMISPMHIDEIKEAFKEKASAKIYSKVLSMEIEKIIIQKLVESFKEGAFASKLGPMSFFINDHLVEGIGTKIEPIIAQFIEEEGEKLIYEQTSQEVDDLLDLTLSDIAEKVYKYKDTLVEAAKEGYKHLVETKLGEILEVINMQNMIQNKILSLDTETMEKIILDIMHKELNAVIGFGVILGMIMGAIASIL